MGAAASSPENDGSGKKGLEDLPESCVAAVLVHLDPLEICGAARLNRAFRGAATADTVWGPKLPENYRQILQKVEGEAKEPASKKEIYARLCHPNPIDGGSKVFWLDKCWGRICMLISSAALAITGIDDRRYWSRIPTDESRYDLEQIFHGQFHGWYHTFRSGMEGGRMSGELGFQEDCGFQSVAYLQQTWWLQVDGEMDFPLPAGTYSLFYRLHLGRPTKKLGRRACNSKHVHGWGMKPVRFRLSTSCGQRALTECYMGEPGVWTIHHVGDFAVANPQVPTKVKFSMTQIDCTHTKGGLCVDSVLVCPRGFAPHKAFL